MFPKNVYNTVLVGEPYKSKEKFTLFDSKIGGLPLWVNSAPLNYPYQCSTCGKELFLLLQLYEPTDDLDRVLYVFCCKSSNCQLTPNGWKVIRQQQPVKEAEVVKEATKPAVSTGLSWNFSSSSSSSVSNSDLLKLLNQMEKKTSLAAAPAKTTSQPSKKAIKATKFTGERICIPEWFVDVFDEPMEKKSKSKSSKLSNDIAVESTETGESYDQDKKMSRYLKFNAAIKRCPSQVIRIAYPGGQPLFPSTQVVPTLPKCPCGGNRVFEVQILPTILSFIPQEEVSFESLKDEKDWSSVLIYSCENHCNNDEECVVVLPPLFLVCLQPFISN